MMTTFLFTSILAISCQQTPPNAMDASPRTSATFSNPVWPSNFPDPHIVFHEGTFYAYATHNSARGFQVLESKDMVAWKELPAVGKPTWSDGQYWAPEVHLYKGKWYLFYSAQDRVTKKRDAAVAVGDTPLGPFKDVAKLVLGKDLTDDPGDNGAIDQTLFVEDDGTPYLLYIREPGPRSLNMVKLAPDLSRTVGEHKVLLLADRPEEKGVLDAPTLVKRDGKYWLFYSSGWFQSWKRDACYQVYVASSKSLFGPYTKPEKPILTTRADAVYSPGHQCLIELPSGEWWMGYHAWDATGEPMYGHNKAGRSLRIDRVTWTATGPNCNGPTTDPQPLPKLSK